MSFVEKRADFIAVQGYQSIYTAKKEHSKMIKQALLKQYLFYRISSEIQQFENGLNDVGGLWNLIQLNAEEFYSLFTFVPTEMSRSAFKSLCKIDWSPVGSNKRQREDATIYCWELFLKQIEDGQLNYKMNSEEQQVYFKELLKFITGADAVPPLGFRYPLTIQFFEQEKESTRLPYASTCGLELYLPRGHEDSESFVALMCNSLFNSCGFGKV
ncbi:hypothetical protein QZH41_020584 [Actinostola sp. cb2023]|nr:hypothetical protein QZH41_014065 [Actinostola sp. cb2023]KAK3753110.1 hypothetical protein QZH41_020584 [Actinostola sp. cb2023]